MHEKVQSWHLMIPSDSKQYPLVALEHYQIWPEINKQNALLAGIGLKNNGAQTYHVWNLEFEFSLPTSHSPLTTAKCCPGGPHKQKSQAL